MNQPKFPTPQCSILDDQPRPDHAFENGTLNPDNYRDDYWALNQSELNLQLE
jgi:hypothetical protein